MIYSLLFSSEGKETVLNDLQAIRCAEKEALKAMFGAESDVAKGNHMQSMARKLGTMVRICVDATHER